MTWLCLRLVAVMYEPKWTSSVGSCDCSFRDESLDTLVKLINQLTFMTAVGMIDNNTFAGRKVRPEGTATIVGVSQHASTAFRTLRGTMQVTDVVYYQTYYWSTGSATLSTLVCIERANTAEADGDLRSSSRMRAIAQSCMASSMGGKIMLRIGSHGRLERVPSWICQSRRKQLKGSEEKIE